MTAETWTGYRSIPVSRSGQSFFLDLLLVVSLLLSVSTQLRPTELSIGPGEAGLAVWLAFAFFQKVLRQTPPLSLPLAKLLTFWVVLGFALCLGAAAALAIGDPHDPGLSRHDQMAYVLMAGLSVLFTIVFATQGRSRRFLWLLASFGAVWLVLQVAWALSGLSFGSFGPWEWDRLRGICDDSNQLASVCVVLACLSLHLADTAMRAVERFAALAFMVVAIVAGRLSKSDAFTLAAIAGAFVYITLKIRGWSRRWPGRVGVVLAIGTLVLSPLLATAVLVDGHFEAQLERIGEGLTRGGATGAAKHTADLRFQIWGDAIRRGMESDMLGLGPGPHLPIPRSLVAGRANEMDDPDRAFHPTPGRVPNFEAHNTFLDLFVQGGLIAVIDLVWLGATIVRGTFRAQMYALTTLIFAIAVFSFFHLVVRHPMIWVAVSFSLVAMSQRPNNVPVSRGLT
jgi:O-Antigen ligase